jgi:hypothetical protein
MTETQLDRIERIMIENEQLKALGHRIIFDTETGWSKNVVGVWCHPKCLDENGYHVRHLSLEEKRNVKYPWIK